MKISKFLILILLTGVFACHNNHILETGLEGINESIREQFAPDKRTAIYTIKIDSRDSKILVSGETNSKIAYQKLLDSLQSLDIAFINNVRILPDSVLGDKSYAVARNSVINIRSEPKHSAELGTQGLLGMPLKVLDKEGDFYRIQTPDNYISWVDKGGITRMTKEEFENWKATDKVIFTKNFGYVYEDDSFKNVVSDISLGGILKLIDEHKNCYEVQYPDKRKGFIKIDEASKFKAFIEPIFNNKELSVTQENVENIAKTMQGFPYLWGGTSAKGIDCSGFTKMVFLMNGYVIPRDASQQILAGKVVDKNLDFKELQKGDLLFFGKKATEDSKQRVTHVGIWLGNGKQEFIHSSGNVHISSMNENEPNYDEFNKNRYLGSRRYIGVKDKNILELKEVY